MKYLFLLFGCFFLIVCAYGVSFTESFAAARPYAAAAIVLLSITAQKVFND